MPAVSNVLIVGGGIAGMTLAISLKRAGIAADIVEINPQWTVPGVGISLGGPALRALRTVGVLEECVQSGFGYSHFRACDGDGNVTGTVQLPRLNGPQYPATIGIMRQSLHAVLMRALNAAMIHVRLGVTVASIDQDDGCAHVVFSDGTTDTYDLIVGADGSNSKIRDLVFGTGCGPHYTGQAVWRATVNRPAAVDGRFSFYGPRSKAGFNPVSGRQMYIYLLQNLPQFVRLPDAELAGVMCDLLADFGGIIAAARDEIVAPEQIVYRPVGSHILPSPWYRGHVILIGDAAHTTTPHMAAGAGIAVEDSVVLAQLLRSDAPLPRLLQDFMARRYERCRMVVENSIQLGEWEKEPNSPDADPVGILDASMRALAEPI